MRQPTTHYANNNLQVKKQNSITVVILLSTTLVILFVSSCKDNGNQVLANKLAGKWLVKQINFANPNQPGVDSVLVLNGAEMSFSACTFDGDTHTDCPGTYKLLSKQETNFPYMLYTNDGEKVFMQFAQNVPPNEFSLNGMFVISRAKEGQLKIKGSLGWNNSDGKRVLLDRTAYLTLVRP